MSATSTDRQPGRRTTDPARIPMADARRIAGRLLATARYRTGGNVYCCRERLTRRLAKGRCEVTGIAFDLAAVDECSRPLAPSLDRIEPGGKYTLKNIRIVVWAFNRFRSDMPLDEARQLILTMAESMQSR